jgi:hypothetical protein
MAPKAPLDVLDHDLGSVAFGGGGSANFRGAIATEAAGTLAASAA